MRAAPGSLAERETVIRWDREERVVHVWSADPVTWRRMEKLGIDPSREDTCEQGVLSRFYEVPLERFRWGLKRRVRAGGVSSLVRKCNGESAEPGD